MTIDLSSMSKIERAKYMLNLYLNAGIAIIHGAQSYTISGKTITRANLHDIILQRKYWENQLSILNGGSARKFRTVKVED